MGATTDGSGGRCADGRDRLRRRLRVALRTMTVGTGWLVVGAALLGLSGGVARADSPGRFDYYVLALSWSPQHCEGVEAPAAGEPQCARPYGFVVHGLWPQFEPRGWPKNCGLGSYLSQPLVESLLPLMPSRSLIRHEWRKHGVCSGLRPEAYFATVTRAAAAVTVPTRYRRLGEPLQVTGRQVEREFIAANPALSEAGVAVQCRANYLSEVRVCLTRDLQPRRCGADVTDRCGVGRVVMRPQRVGRGG